MEPKNLRLDKLHVSHCMTYIGVTPQAEDGSVFREVFLNTSRNEVAAWSRQHPHSATHGRESIESLTIDQWEATAKKHERGYSKEVAAIYKQWLLLDRSPPDINGVF